MESIRETAQKIKQKTKVALMFPHTDLLIVLIITLVGFGGFGLGRLSTQEYKKTPVTVTGSASQVASVGDISTPVLGEVVASKNGSKYHFPWCSGAQRISDKNLISFNSIEEAKKAGYTAAANCKGLR